VGFYATASNLRIYKALAYSGGRLFLSIIERGCIADIQMCANGVRIMNMTNPGNPIEEGFVAGKLYSDAAIYQNYLYLSDAVSEGITVDISNLLDPIVLETKLLVSGEADLHIQDEYLFITRYRYTHMSVFSLADPTAPGFVGYYTSPEPIEAVDFAGSYAYFATDRLRVVNIQNPVQPVEVGAYTELPNERVSDVAVSGNHLFV
jgi:hypothetical protein